MSAVAMPITVMLIESAVRRPSRSPISPNRTPPTGRSRNATPKTARDCSSSDVASPEGKNVAPIATAKKP